MLTMFAFILWLCNHGGTPAHNVPITVLLPHKQYPSPRHSHNSCPLPSYYCGNSTQKNSRYRGLPRQYLHCISLFWDCVNFSQMCHWVLPTHCSLSLILMCAFCYSYGLVCLLICCHCIPAFSTSRAFHFTLLRFADSNLQLVKQLCVTKCCGSF